VLQRGLRWTRKTKTVELFVNPGRFYCGCGCCEIVDANIQLFF
jgi:hypothetical protein